MYKRTNTHKLISYQFNEVITTNPQPSQQESTLSYHINNKWVLENTLKTKKKKKTYLLTPINPILQMENKRRKTTQLHVKRDERRGREREREKACELLLLQILA
jgi:hypothetical protein